MARRATLDRGVPRDADDDSAAIGPPAARPGRRPAGRGPEQRPGPVPWRGSGGRWLVWTLRVIAWTVLLVIGYRGVLAIIQGPGSSSGSAPAPSAAPGSGFPVTTAEAYALQFGNVYLSFSPSTASSRAQILADMLPAGAAAQLGWNGAGTQTLTSDTVTGIQVQGPHAAVVDLLAVINGGTPVELGVPVYASGGALVVTGEPALLPVPRAAAPPTAPAVNTDPTATQELQNQLPPFFAAYASGDNLSRYLVQGARVAGLGGAVSLNTSASSPVTVIVPPGGAVRHITAIVSWIVPGSTQVTSQGRHAAPQVSTATLEMTYDMTVVEQDNTWYGQSITASDQLPGPP